MSLSRFAPLLFCLAIVSLANAQNIVAPKAGIPIPPEVKTELQQRIEKLNALVADVQEKLSNAEHQPLRRFLPDAEVLIRAVERTLEDEIFFKKGEFDQAREQLNQGEERLSQLMQGKAPWNEQTGLVTRGYRSRIDGSLQPYQILVPENFKRNGEARRLDIWYHGRNNNLSEVAFLGRGARNAGPFAPENGFVLAPYGRFCNAMKFAGETDTWEAIAHAKSFYKIDDNKISVRGFSMGGAAAWHIGAHYASRWAAVNPGAGFVETKIYQNLTDQLDDIPEYEQKLWRFTDALEYAVNLENTTLVAYSGEIDKQKAAADLMEKKLAENGITMTHIIGPKTGHKYEPLAQKQVAKLVDAAAAKGRNSLPGTIRFVTYTLKYNRMHWLTIDSLKQHWELAEVHATFKASTINAKTKNISAITFHRDDADSITIDGQTFDSPHRSFIQENGKWKVGSPTGLRKQHNLQGPIDDCFTDSFLFVPPATAGWSQQNDDWVKNESNDASFQWCRQMRGGPRVKSADEISDADLQSSNLVLWGDPKSNPLIAKIVDRLPIRWSEKQIEIAGEKFNAENSIPVLIYPNPLNPKRYVVLNSGPTFMQFGAQSNSQQTPKLPDFAILDTGVSVQKRIRGNGVRHADFFNEQWRVE